VSKKTLGKLSLPSVDTRQRIICRVFFLPSVFLFGTRQPEKKHSVNHLALGKEPDSGSASCYRVSTLNYIHPPQQMVHQNNFCYSNRAAHGAEAKKKPTQLVKLSCVALDISKGYTGVFEYFI
jgi:hypothetical protein